ncbi:Acyl-CoA N-acyltransferase [Moelleriella libera RCEF 2490]|uniref:Acyl-CoA N-acyltransferase n=1 Tax=Moelleriella libera RCEF 2490 TaxID=1081109 RepID=A0A168BWW6_9HYPO|nr:Acyl-CoA N-acyltransferase [Moelleriella libera RCEF 2490]
MTESDHSDYSSDPDHFYSSSEQHRFRSSSFQYTAFNASDKDQVYNFLMKDPEILLSHGSTRWQPFNRDFTDKLCDDLVENTDLLVWIYRLPLYDGDNGEPPVGILFLKTLENSNMLYRGSAEIGVVISAHLRGMGYATEAVEWAIHWAFHMAGLHRVEIKLPEWNDGAKKFFKTIGFLEEGRRRKVLFRGDKIWDEVHMGLLMGEWALRRQELSLSSYCDQGCS